MAALLAVVTLTVTVLPSLQILADGPEIASFASGDPAYTETVPLGTPADEIEFPETLEATLKDGSVKTIPVTWTSADYDADTAGVYTFAAQFSGYMYAAARPYAVITVDEAALKPRRQPGSGEQTAEDALTALISEVIDRLPDTGTVKGLDKDSEALKRVCADVDLIASLMADLSAGSLADLEQAVGAARLAKLNGIFEYLSAQTDALKPQVVRGPRAPIGNDAYISNFRIEITDGTAPWGNTQQPGSDVGPKNKVVRTYDAVIYNLSTSTTLYAGKKPYEGERIKYEMILPYTQDQLEPDESLLGWADKSAGYTYQITQENRMVNGVMTPCQVVTAYKLLEIAEGVPFAVPGQCTVAFGVRVKAMADGAAVQPIFTAKLEHNTEADELRTKTADAVSVSAKLNLNVSLDTYDRQVTFEKSDFSTGNAAALDKTPAFNGRVQRQVVGVAVRMVSPDAPGNSIRGCALPSGPITFKLREKATLNSEDKSTDPNFYRRIWSYGPNDAGNPGIDGRDQILRGKAYSETVPFNSGGGIDACFNGGDWVLNRVSPTEIDIEVSNYVVDVDHFPKRTAGLRQKDASIRDTYGIISAAELHTVLPIEYFNSAAFSSGTHNLKTTETVTDLQATSTFGTIQQDSPGTADAQPVQTDKEDVMTQTRTIIGGAASVYKVGFFRPYQEYDAVVNPDWRPLNIFSNGAFPYEGQYAPHATVNLGEKVTFSSTFIAYNGVYKNMYVPDYSTTNPEFRTFYVINFFDADVFEFLGIRDLAPRSNIPSWGETKLYYLTKADGSNFSNSNELTLQSTQGLGNGIRGYGQLSDIPAGHKCIGFLWMGKNPPSLGKMHYVMYGADFKIKENVNNIGKYAGIAGTYGSNEAFPYGYSPPPPWWPPPNPPQPWPPGYKPPEWPEPQQYIKFRDLYSLISHELDTKHYVPGFYYPAYWPGYGPNPEPNYNVGWFPWGMQTPSYTGPNDSISYPRGYMDGVHIGGFESWIQKSLSQTQGGAEKSSYLLDFDEKEVDYALEPEIMADSSIPPTVKDTVTITDTLPKELRYKPGSAYYGGTYAMSPQGGGHQGKVTGGVRKEPTVVNNVDGTQTLTWTFPNQPVVQAMEKIHYTATIVSGRENNVVQATNVAWIKLSKDGATPDPSQKSTASINIVSLSAESFGKFPQTPVVSKQQSIFKYHLFNSNTFLSPLTNATLIDTLPYKGDAVGSDFDGTLKVHRFKVDPTYLDLSKMKLYYTTDAAYKGKTSQDLTLSEIKSSWTQAVIQPDGTSTDMNSKAVVCWALTGELGVKKSMVVDLELEQDIAQSKAGDKYVNRASTFGGDPIPSPVRVVEYSISGCTWLDANQDGIQDPSESKFDGLTATLLRLTPGGNPANESDYAVYTPDIGGVPTPMAVAIGKQRNVLTGVESTYQTGEYKFTEVPTGVYAVKITDGTTMKLMHYTASLVNQGSDDTVDSDAEPTMTNGLLTQTLIKQIKVEAADETSPAVVEIAHNDAGFFRNSLIFKKLDPQGQILPDAGFTLYEAQPSGTGYTWNSGSPVKPEVKSSAAGLVIFHGVEPNKQYILAETTAPLNYRASTPNDYILVDVAADGSYTLTGYGFFADAGMISESGGMYQVKNAYAEAKIKIRKVISNYAAYGTQLKDHAFMIHLRGDMTASTVLKHGERSGTITHLVDGSSDTVDIVEIVPMEYSQGYTVSSEIHHADGTQETKTGRQLTLLPGDEVTVTVTNTFEHKAYFKDRGFVDNRFVP